MLSAIEKIRRAVQTAPTWVGWRHIIQRDPCVYCCAWPLPQRDGDRMTIEHILPKSEGGPNGWRNTVGAHAACNESRSSAPLLHFLVYRHRLGMLTGKPNRKRRKRLRRDLVIAPIVKENADRPSRSIDG